MRVTVLHRSRSITVLDCRCEAKPGDASFDEHHAAFSVAYVRRGSFSYRSHGRAFELVAGATLVGHAGDEYRCTHEHHLAGDECLAVLLSAELADDLGATPTDWRIGALPPLSG